MAIYHITIPILCALLMNGLIYGLHIGRNKQDQKEMKEMKSARNPLLPPGWVIALVWFLLFGILGYLHYCLTVDGSGIGAWSIVGFFVWALAYPLLTKGLQMSSRRTRILNLVSLIIAFNVAIVVAMTSKEKKKIKHVALVVPLLTWVIYVNVVQIVEC